MLVYSYFPCSNTMFYSLTSLLTFLALGAGVAANNSTSGGCTITSYVLALQGNTVKFSLFTLSLILDDCNFGYDTIHGLWPDPESSCTSCTSEKFDEAKLSSSTLSGMNKYWPTCQSGTNHDFWDHEWSKHGTCSGMTQDKYFSEALSLYSSYNSKCTKDCHLCFTPTFSYTGTSC
jgi:hypothetical protein